MLSGERGKAMLNERLHAARQIRAAINPAEQAADESWLASLKLGVAICEARRGARVSIHTGADCVEEVQAAIFHAGENLTRLLKAHRLMADLQQEVLPGISPRMAGDLGGCPPGKEPVVTGRQSLRAVD